MAYPNTPGGTRTFADGWQSANDVHAAAHIWKVEADIKFLRYEADYYSGGQILAKFKDASIASVIIKLQSAVRAGEGVKKGLSLTTP